MNKTLIFDLDGTLLDSLKDIAISMNRVLQSLNLEPFEIQKYKEFVGGGIDILAFNVINTLHVKMDVRELSKLFKTEYEKSLHEHTKPYEGVFALLKKIKSKKFNLAILSNKPHELTCEYVRQFFNSYNFTQVFGQREGVPKKPEPFVALEIAKYFKVLPQECFFIGDTKVDMQTANNASMKSIGVLWGFRDKKELVDNGAQFLVSRPMEIYDVVSHC